MADRRLKAVATAEQYSQGNIGGLDDAATRRLVASTVLTESSGGDLGVVNRFGYVGRYQAGAAWLVDAGYLDMDKYRAARASMSSSEWERGGGQLRFMKDASNWKDGLSYERYIGSAELQDRAFKINSDAAYRRAIREGVLKEDDSQERIAGFLKARHLSGYEGARDVVTGGRVRRDANGTSNYDYYHDISRNRDGLDQPMGYQRGARSESVGSVQVDGQTAGVATAALLKDGSTGASVRDLQEQLGKLGYLGKNGQPLALDGKFGPQTEHAVREFQTMHGLKVDGIVGPQTMSALEQARQQPLVTEATHPNHALYQTIAQRLPAGTDPKVAANITLQAMENGIDTPSKVAGVHVAGSNVHVLGAGNDPALRSRTDLNAPTPDLQEMSDHMAHETAQQQQQQQQQRQQQHAHGFAP